MVGIWKVRSERCSRRGVVDGGREEGISLVDDGIWSEALADVTECMGPDVNVDGCSLPAIVANSEHSGLKNQEATDAHWKHIIITLTFSGTSSKILFNYWNRNACNMRKVLAYEDVQSKSMYNWMNRCWDSYSYGIDCSFNSRKHFVFKEMRTLECSFILRTVKLQQICVSHLT